MKIWSQTSEDNRDSGILSNPLSFIRSGYILWSNNVTYEREISGNYWVLRSNGVINSNTLIFGNINLYSDTNHARGYGFAVLQILHHSH